MLSDWLIIKLAKWLGCEADEIELTHPDATLLSQALSARVINRKEYEQAMQQIFRPAVVSHTLTAEEYEAIQTGETSDWVW